MHRLFLGLTVATVAIAPLASAAIETGNCFTSASPKRFPSAVAAALARAWAASK